MLIAYTCALLLALLCGLPFWLLSMATKGKYREGLSERLGVGARPLAGGRCAANDLGTCGLGRRSACGQPPGE